MIEARRLDRLVRSLADRYRLEKEVGRGGMATVFKATDVKHGRPVALKVLHPELTSGLTAERFGQEIRIAARLQHPHIVPLYDSGEAAGLLYYVMPLVTGEPVRERLGREGALPLEDALRLGEEVAGALDYAHRHDVVHRDIKPENILLSDGHAVLADFGIATALDSAPQGTLTRTGTVVGTPRYMSPEQVEAGDVDGRADIYSLGCVLYEAITGEPPFDGPTVLAVLARHAVGDPKGLREHRPEVPEDVERIVLKAMARVRDLRFASAGELRRALQRAPRRASAVREPRPSTEDDGSIAVLPFVDMSSEGDQQYFGDGIAEELINALTRVEGLRVAARTSSFSLGRDQPDVRSVGSKLGVGAVLEGSVRKAGNRLRITAQLIEVETGYHLWSERYDRDFSDVFAIQDEITEVIVSTVAPKLRSGTGVPRVSTGSDSFPAYELYLKGRHLWYNRFRLGLVRALEYFHKARELDPEFALPYTGIADTMTTLGYLGMIPPEQARETSLPAAAYALELDPGLPQAHFSMGLAQFFLNWDWAAAEKHLGLAYGLGGNRGEARVFHALLETLQGRPETGRRLALEATLSEPESAYVAGQVAHERLWAGVPGAALEGCRSVLEREPGGVVAMVIGGVAAAAVERYGEARSLLERAVDLSNRGPSFLAGLGAAHAMAGNRSEAEAILSELRARGGQEYVAPVALAAVSAGLGRRDDAFRHLDEAVRERSPSLVMTIRYPLWQPLHEDPRFEELLEGVGLSSPKGGIAEEPERAQALQPGSSDSPEGTAPAHTEVRAGSVSVAVVPFSEGGGDEEEQYLGGGIAESIAHALSRAGGFTVAGWESTLRLHEQGLEGPSIGRRLRASAVLEGALTKTPEGLELSVRLVASKDGASLWSGSYEGEAREIFAFQDEIVGAVRQRLEAGGSHMPRAGASGGPDPEAYQLYLEGRYHWYKRFGGGPRDGGSRAASRFFQEAIEKDPEFPPPYAALADAYQSMAIFGFVPPEPARTRALEAAERALELDPLLAKAHFARAGGLLFFERDLHEAERVFGRALELDPSYAEALAWKAFAPTLAGEAERGLEMVRQARLLEPDSPYVATLDALVQTWSGRREAAARTLGWVLEEEPGLSNAHFLLGDLRSSFGQHEDAIGSFEEALALADRSLTWLCALGAAYGRGGRDQDAATIRSEIEERQAQEYVSPAGLAWLDANTGREEEAFQWLEAARDEESPTLLISLLMPVFDRIREDPRFRELLARMSVAAP